MDSPLLVLEKEMVNINALSTVFDKAPNYFKVFKQYAINSRWRLLIYLCIFCLNC